MVLVMRRKDGKFYDHYKGRKLAFYHKQEAWKDNPTCCNPFVSERAARQVLSPWIPSGNCTCPNNGQPSWRGKCTKDCYRITERRKRFDEAYVIVPARVEVTP